MSCGVEYKKFDERHSCVRPEGHDGSHRCGCGATMKPNEPPQGWFAFGTHADTPGRLEFSEALDDGGMPKWERPAPGSTERESA